MNKNLPSVSCVIATYNSSKRIPVIGANGLILPRKYLKKINIIPENFFHTNINYDLIQKWFNNYALVKGNIIHLKKQKSLTFVKPIFDAIRGFTKVRDVAWFLHPIICFSYLIVYSWAVTARAIKKVL